jgi:HEAT repeats
MPISVLCGGCAEKYRVRDDAAGKKFACTSCGRTVQVPAKSGNEKILRKTTAAKPQPAVHYTPPPVRWRARRHSQETDSPETRDFFVAVMNRTAKIVGVICGLFVCGFFLIIGISVTNEMRRQAARDRDAMASDRPGNEVEPLPETGFGNQPPIAFRENPGIDFGVNPGAPTIPAGMPTGTGIPGGPGGMPGMPGGPGIAAGPGIAGGPGMPGVAGGLGMPGVEGGAGVPGIGAGPSIPLGTGGLGVPGGAGGPGMPVPAGPAGFPPRSPNPAGAPTGISGPAGGPMMPSGAGPGPAPVGNDPQNFNPNTPQRSALQLAVELESNNTPRIKLALQELALLKPQNPRARIAKAAENILVNHQDVALRNSAAVVLEKWATSKNIEGLISSMTDSSPYVRLSVIKTLGKLKAVDAIPAIAKRLARNLERSVAAEALIRIGSDAEGAVLELLSNEESAVRLEACKILDAIGTNGSLEALEALAESDGSAQVEAAARDAIRSIKGR